MCTSARPPWMPSPYVLGCPSPDGTSPPAHGNGLSLIPTSLYPLQPLAVLSYRLLDPLLTGARFFHTTIYGPSLSCPMIVISLYSCLLPGCRQPWRHTWSMFLIHLTALPALTRFFFLFNGLNTFRLPHHFMTRFSSSSISPFMVL